MFVPLLLLLHLTQFTPPPEPATAPQSSAEIRSPAVASGHGAPTVTIPRIDAVVQVDGKLDEAVWTSAAKLTGFSQYQPVDGPPRRGTDRGPGVVIAVRPAHRDHRV